MMLHMTSKEITEEVADQILAASGDYEYLQLDWQKVHLQWMNGEANIQEDRDADTLRRGALEKLYEIVEETGVTVKEASQYRREHPKPVAL